MSQSVLMALQEGTVQGIIIMVKRNAGTHVQLDDKTLAMAVRTVLSEIEWTESAINHWLDFYGLPDK